MADQKFYVIDQNTGDLIPLKLIDPGDDTGYSLATSGGAGGVGAGDASAANQVVTNAKLTTLLAQTDGLEASLTSIDGKLVASPSTAAKQDTGNTSLANIDAGIPASLGSTTAANSMPVTLSTDGQFVTSTGSLTETAPATDTASSGLNGRLQRIAQRITSLIALLPASLGANGGLKIEGVASGTTVPVTTAAGELHLGEIGGNLLMISTEFTRPSDTSAYTAGDAVSNDTTTTTMQALANAARVSGGSGYITGVRVTTDKKSITPRFRVHFWNTNGATVAGDNVAFKSVYADVSKRVGYIDMAAMSTPADTSNSDMSTAIDLTIRIPYTCAATSLYYTIETLDAWTPASAEKIAVTIFADRN